MRIKYQHIQPAVVLFFIYSAVLATGWFAKRGKMPNLRCLWPMTEMNRSNCEMYRCMEEQLKCGKKGFLIGYAYRFCVMLDKTKNCFSPEGQKWAQEVKTCVMRETHLAIHVTSTTCSMLLEDGLYRIGQCYITAEPHLCRIIQEEQNHQALAHVLDVQTMPGEASEFAVHQISAASRSCMHIHYNTYLGSLDSVRANVEEFINTMGNLLPYDHTLAVQGIKDAQCQRFAEKGDCRFLECFEEKFPCSSASMPGHIKYLELPLCQDMTTFISLSPSSKAPAWLRRHHKCLFKELLTIYKRKCIPCAHLHDYMISKRHECMVSTGICAIKAEDLAISLDLAIDLETYPLSVPFKIVTGSISDFDFKVPEYYYRHLSGLQAQLGDVQCECRMSHDGTCTPLYEEVYNKQIEANHFVMKEYKSLGRTRKRNKRTPKGKETIDLNPYDRNSKRQLCYSEKDMVPARKKPCYPGEDNRNNEVFKCVKGPIGQCFRVPVSSGQTAQTLQEARGNLHLYVLPVGQGDGQIIQCPDGNLTIVDLGSTSKKGSRFWKAQDIRRFLEGKEKLIRNIVVTHNHQDHYNLLREVFPNGTLRDDVNIYITCNVPTNEPGQKLQEWINDSNLRTKVIRFNNGISCGTANTGDCPRINLCPNNMDYVLAANQGGCRDHSSNRDSIVFKIVWGDVSVLMPGDFEGVQLQKKMVQYYQNHPYMTLNSTVYKVSHHGSNSSANREFFRNAVGPKAVIVSADQDSNYGHPACDALEGYRTLCHPNEKNSLSEGYCQKECVEFKEIQVQLRYTCYMGKEKKKCMRYDNNKAIYTTSQDHNTINLIVFSTNGVQWWITHTPLS